MTLLIGVEISASKQILKAVKLKEFKQRIGEKRKENRIFSKTFPVWPSYFYNEDEIYDIIRRPFAPLC